MTQRRRAKGQQGIAIVMTSLVLLPLMVFAAFGVDLASWYSRVSYLQKAADAASLAGTVWMPDLDQSTTVACASLAENGVTGGPACGTGPFTVLIARGATPTSLRVSVTDPDAKRYFSQVFRGTQSLTRSAEAEYNLPIPLGSPLNYFGGDNTRTVPPSVTTYQLNWPIPYNNEDTTTGWQPVNLTSSGNSSRCNVGTAAAQNYGGWRYGTPLDYRADDFDGSRPQCQWTVRTLPGSAGTTNTPPAGHFLVTVPSNGGSGGNCWIDSNGSSGGGVSWGRWINSVFTRTITTTGTRCSWGGSQTPPQPALPTNSSSCQVDSNFSAPGGTFWGRYSSGSWVTSQSGSPPLCSWTTPAVPSTIASTVPPFSQSRPPITRPCNVGLEATYGTWPSSGNWVPNSAPGGRPLCRWYADIDTTVTTPPNPIDSTRSPGFWASISGPGGVATQGNAYSVRCTFELDDCSSGNANTMYRDTGFWYVVKMPATGATATDIRVFDASYNKSGSASSGAGDSSDDNIDFDVEYQVFQQTNPLDFNARTPVANCSWDLAPTSENVTTYGGKWQTLCSLSPSNGSIYLVNVKTTSDDGQGAGVNSYALEAVASGCAVDGPCQPAVYAYGDMGMYNNIDAGLSTFYLAEVGPQFAGRTLVIELWDSGDANGVAQLTPMKPSTDAMTPKPVVPVLSTECSYGADTPNPRHGSGQFGGATSAGVAAGTVPSGTNCTILTANQPNASGTPRVNIFNDEWLTIRVKIPGTYSCVLGVNPETDGNSCWWGIQYNFSKTATDVTTWRARIEGNPVHLTQ